MKEIPLTKGFTTIVDDCDYEELVQYKWYAAVIRGMPRAVRSVRGEDGKQRSLLMARQIMDPPKGMHVDHRDHDTLNDQRANLRVCSRSQNSANARKAAERSSRYKGVSWAGARGKWQARISVNGKRTFLGLFDDETDAARAYNVAAIAGFGAFALVNVIDMH